MKKDVTYIDAAKFQEILEASGLAYKEQKGFIQVMGPHLAKGPKVYVAKTKLVARVDLSGFSQDGEGFTQLGDESFGAVSCQMDFSRPEEAVLTTFTELLKTLASLPASPPRVRGAKGNASGAKGWSLARPPVQGPSLPPEVLMAQVESAGESA